MENLMDKRMHDGRLQYKVNWSKASDGSELPSTWEPAENIDTSMIDEVKISLAARANVWPV